MKLMFDHKGKKLTYTSEWVGSTLWIHMNGKTFSVEDPAQAKKGRRRQESAGHNQVMAPMPGKVTKILVSQGQNVKKGQAVLVMEAMKMEYTLKADVEGSVKAIQVQAGSQVTLGQALVELTEAGK